MPSSLAEVLRRLGLPDDEEENPVDLSQSTIPTAQFLPPSLRAVGSTFAKASQSWWDAAKDFYAMMQLPNMPKPPKPVEQMTKPEIQAFMNTPEYKNALESRAMSFGSMAAPLKIEGNAPPFFSALRKIAEEKLPNIFEGTQAKNTFRKIDAEGKVQWKGITPDEWANSGLEEKLKPGVKWNKSEVLKHIDESTPELKDVVLEERGKPWHDNNDAYRDIYKRWEQYATERGKTPAQATQSWLDNTPEVNRWYASDPAAQAYKNRDVGRPKFSTHQESGGTSYKEMFVTAPRPQRTRDLENIGHPNRLTQQEFDELSNAGPKWSDGHPYYSDIENPIVRLRFNDRISSDGKRVLFLEEVQPPSEAEQAKMPEALRKRWREIGMKRAIKYAADNGYDRVAWTTGEMQVARYPGIETQVKSMGYQVLPDGKYAVTALPKGEQEYRSLGFFAAEELPQTVGKGNARTIISRSKIKSYGAISNTELAENTKIGGEGLKRLYDADLGNVVKKLGAKVESIDIPTLEKKPFTPSAGLGDPYEGRSGIVPSIDIAPLKSKASQGFPIFSIVPPVTAGTLAAITDEGPPSSRKRKSKEKD